MVVGAPAFLEDENEMLCLPLVRSNNKYMSHSQMLGKVEYGLPAKI